MGAVTVAETALLTKLDDGQLAFAGTFATALVGLAGTLVGRGKDGSS